MSRPTAMAGAAMSRPTEMGAPAEAAARAAERTLRAALWGAAGFALGYLAPGTLRLPVLAYDPVGRAFLFSSNLRGVQMRYYGDLMMACAAGLAAALLSYALPRRGRLDILVATAAALSIIALDLAFYLSRLFTAV